MAGREIRGKISSVKNTQKITAAMELVAASKMRRAQERMQRAKPYADKIRDVISHVAASQSESRHPYLEPRETIKRVGFIVVSTDRGLCGGLNINLFRKTLIEMRQYQQQGLGVDVCLIGRKAEAFFSRLSATILGTKTQLGDEPPAHELIGVVKVMIDRFDSGELDRVFVVHNEFLNTMTQRPRSLQLLPLPVSEEEKDHGHWDYIYEPDSAKELLTRLIVRYIESQVYRGVMENIACEQAARMVAMKSATENAGDIIDELQLAYNKARQASITSEIAEIVGGAAAIDA
jgi:F-type H+-transporting ATPase subunit gamma